MSEHSTCALEVRCPLCLCLVHNTKYKQTAVHSAQIWKCEQNYDTTIRKPCCRIDTLCCQHGTQNRTKEGPCILCMMASEKACLMKQC